MLALPRAARPRAYGATRPPKWPGTGLPLFPDNTNYCPIRPAPVKQQLVHSAHRRLRPERHGTPCCAIQDQSSGPRQSPGRALTPPTEGRGRLLHATDGREKPYVLLARLVGLSEGRGGASGAGGPGPRVCARYSGGTSSAPSLRPSQPPNSSALSGPRPGGQRTLNQAPRSPLLWSPHLPHCCERTPRSGVKNIREGQQPDDEAARGQDGFGPATAPRGYVPRPQRPARLLGKGRLPQGQACSAQKFSVSLRQRHVSRSPNFWAYASARDGMGREQPHSRIRSVFPASFCFQFLEHFLTAAARPRNLGAG